MRRKGKSVREIASELGVSKSWVGKLSTNLSTVDSTVDNAEPDGEDKPKESLPPSGGNGLSTNSFPLGFVDVDTPSIEIRETEPESAQSAPDIPLTSKEGPSKKRKRPTAKRKTLTVAKVDPLEAKIPSDEQVAAGKVRALENLRIPRSIPSEGGLPV
jgi:hypothetical protein